MRDAVNAVIAVFKEEDFQGCLALIAQMGDEAACLPQMQAVQGIAAARLGAHQLAVACFRRLLDSEPDDPAHPLNLAASLRALNQHDDAQRIVLASLDRHGPSHDHYLMLAQLAVDTSCLRDALTAIEKIPLAQHSGESLLVRGQVQYELGDTASAQISLRAALARRLGSGHDANQAGVLANMLGDFPLAAELFRAAMVATPPYSVAAANLAAQFERLNQVEAAAAVLREYEHDSAPEFSLVRARVCARTGRRDEAAQIYLQLCRLEGQPPLLMYNISFELGKVLDKLGRYGEAMNAFERGHDIALDLANKSFGELAQADAREDWDAPVDGAPERFWKPDTHIERKLQRDAPIFVIGFPRSGTTLMEQVLAAHPALGSLDEILAVDRAIHELGRLNHSYPACLSEISEAVVARAESAYWHEVDKHYLGLPGTRVVDKYPFNLVRLPMIVRMFPGAKVVMLLRHPLDCVLSCYMQKFKLNKGTFSWATLGRTADLYQRAMSTYFRHKQAIGADVLEIKYEDLVSDFEGNVRKVLEYIDVPWNSAVLNYSDVATRRGRISTPSYAQVTEPIYRSAVDRWRNYEHELQSVATELAPLIRKLGYGV